MNIGKRVKEIEVVPIEEVPGGTDPVLDPEPAREPVPEPGKEPVGV